MAGLSDVVKRPFWSKDVCLWVGPEGRLREIVRAEHNETLDLLDLLRQNEDIPVDDAGRARLIESRLDARLRELRRASPGRFVLILKNAALFARYRIGLRSLYDWFGDDVSMAVLMLESETDFGLPLHLRRDDKCDCRATIEYLTSCLANPKLVFREKQ